MRGFLIALLFLCAADKAVQAQAVICPITPSAATNNTLCANTAFVHKAIGASNPTALSFTVATLPAAASYTGMMAYVTDGTSGLTWGQTATGGHSTHYLVWSNGSSWTIVGQ